MAEPQRSGVPDGWEVVDTPKTPAPGTTPTASAGTWEDRGIAGKVWHPADGASERHREDNSVLGLPPEFAALSAVAVAAAAAKPAATVASKGKAIAGALGAQVTPVIKYELIKHGLTAVGVSEGIAIPVAIALTGYKSGAKGAKSAKTVKAPAGELPPVPENIGRPKEWGSPRELTNAMKPTGEALEAAKRKAYAPFEPTPQASAPVETVTAGTPPPSPAPPVAAPIRQSVPGSTLPNQKALNELAIAARRAKVTLTEQDYQVGVQAMEQGGATAGQVVATIARQVNAKARIPAEDVTAYLQLRQLGKSEKEATETLAAMRALRETLNLPKGADVKAHFQKLYERGQKTAPHE